MVFAWSFTEVVRYTHYATGLMDLKLSALEWLRSVLSSLPSQSASHPLAPNRYTTFYPLYPLGAGSEATLIWATLPYAPSPPYPTPSLTSLLPRYINKQYGFIPMVALGAILAIWPPGTSSPQPVRNATNRTSCSAHDDDGTYACSARQACQDQADWDQGEARGGGAGGRVLGYAREEYEEPEADRVGSWSAGCGREGGGKQGRWGSGGGVEMKWSWEDGGLGGRTGGEDGGASVLPASWRV